MAGSTFLVHGRAYCLGHVKTPDGSAFFQGPRILPPTPALYLCTTDVKVLPARSPRPGAQ